MERKTLTGYPRNEYKKRANARLRASGRIPAVLYGSKGTSPISVDSHEFNMKFHTVSENTLIELTVEKDSHDVLVKDFQEDILTGNILHIDFFEVERGKLLKTNIPIHLQGTSIGVREGGVMEQLMHEIEVECLPKDIPASIDIDVTALEEGASIHISEIKAPEGVRFLAADNSVIVSIAHVRGVEELETEAAGGEAEMEGEGTNASAAEESE